MSISTAVRVLIKKAKKDFPGAAEADIAQYVTMHLSLVVANPSATDADTKALAIAKLDEIASNDEAWAISLRDSVLLNVVKPYFDSAVAKGVDPVPVLVTQLDLTEDQALAYVSTLEERATAPVIPAQSTDQDDAPSTDEDEDEASEYNSAVTVNH